MALTMLLMATSLLGGVFATTSTPFPVGVCTAGAPRPINQLSYNVSDGKAACPNLNFSTLWRITVNVTSSLPGEEGHFNASISKGLCSVGLTVYTNDSAITGSRGLISIVYIPTSGIMTMVYIAYAFSGIYLRTVSDHIAVSSDSPPPGFLWDFYGATMNSVLCQLGSDGRLTDAPATLVPYDESSPDCIDAAPYVKATRLTPKMQPVAPGNYTLVLTNDTCTSPFLLRSPPLFYTVLPGNPPASTAVPTEPSPSPTVNSGATIGGIIVGAVSLFVALVAIAALVKWRCAKGAAEPQLVAVHAAQELTARDAALGANIALLAMTEKSPWLEEFSKEIASCHALLPQPLVESCTTEMLIDKLKDTQYSTVYLVLNEPSEELVRAIDEPSFPTNTQHKLVVVELDSSGGTGGGLHRNVTWIPCPPKRRANVKSCAEWVHSYTSMSAVPPPNVVGVHQDEPASVAAMAMSLTPDSNSELGQDPTGLLGAINSMVKDVQRNVTILVDEQQKEKLKLNEN